MRTQRRLLVLASAILLASCSGRETLFEPAPPARFEVPAHLDAPLAEPVPVLAEITTRGDERRLLGDYVTWGRAVAAEVRELRRLIDKWNDRAGAIPPAKK